MRVRYVWVLLCMAGCMTQQEREEREYWLTHDVYLTKHGLTEATLDGDCNAVRCPEGGLPTIRGRVTYGNNLENRVTLYELNGRESDRAMVIQH